MVIQEKIPFIPPAGDRSLRIDFECWKPDPILTAAQSKANQDWTGGTLEPILAEEGLEHVALPQILEHMIKYCWKRASVTPGAARGRITLGATTTHVNAGGQRVFGGRQLAHDLLKNSSNPAEVQRAQAQQAAGRHVAQVQPLVPHGGMVASINAQPHLQGIADDWKTMEQLRRVNAYTFRGDRREPTKILADRGFNPPITRTDAYYMERVVKPAFRSYMKRRYGQDVSDLDATNAINQVAPANSTARHVLNNFFVWRSMAQNESMHLGRMLVDEALKGYISTSRAVSVARGFAKDGGWVYLTRVRGGYLVPDKGTTVWTETFGEQEVALPTRLDWADVFGFRKVGRHQELVGPIYLRKGFSAQRVAFAKVYELLSGMPQV